MTYKQIKEETKGLDYNKQVIYMNSIEITKQDAIENLVRELGTKDFKIVYEAEFTPDNDIRPHTLLLIKTGN